MLIYHRRMGRGPALIFGATASCAAGCGRIDFDVESQAHTDAATDATDGGYRQISRVQPIAERHPGSGASDSFPLQATMAGNAVALQVGCGDAAVPTSLTIDAPGWTFTPLGPVTGSTGRRLWAASFGAIAPDTMQTTFTVTWGGTVCSIGKSELADEFGGADPAGGAITFDAHVETQGTGDCDAMLTTGNAGDAVWAACFSETTILAVGPGYTKGADNGGGDWAEYKITRDPAGTPESVTFDNSNVGYVLTAIVIKPAAL